MFFVLSKLLNFFIKPFSVFLILLFASLLVKNNQLKKRLMITAIVWLLIFSNGFIFNETLRLWEYPAVAIASLPSNEAIAVVLGGGEDTDRAPNDRLFIYKAGERILHAATLYHHGKVSKIIFSGGRARLLEDAQKDNSQVLEFLMMCGVPEEDIILENNSRNTRENAAFVQSLIEEKSIPDNVILVTSAFHMRRSMACFKKVGIDAIAFPCDFYTSLPKDRLSPEKMLPSSEVLNHWNFLIKEWIGIIAYKVAGYI